MAYKDICGYQNTVAELFLLIPIIGIPEGKEKNKGTEKIFEELVGKTPP